MRPYEWLKLSMSCSLRAGRKCGERFVEHTCSKGMCPFRNR